MLIAMINQYGSTWPEILPTVLQKLRGVVNDSTGKSPYEMMFGRVPRMAMDLMLSDLKDINLPNKKQADPALKFRAHWYGPLRVIGTIGTNAMKLRNEENGEVIREGVHVEKLMLKVLWMHNLKRKSTVKNLERVIN